jgi:RsmE family RNA methyltransferase
MNVILLNKDDFIDKTAVRLDGRRAEHILNVLRPSLGDRVKVGIVDGKLGEGILVSEEGDRVELKVGALGVSPPPPLNATLIVAMQRPKTMRKILQSATTMGVKRFFILETWKVEKSYWTSPLLTKAGIKEQLMLGLEQAGDTVMPEVVLKRRFKPFVEDDLPDLLKGCIGFVAHPASVKPCPRDSHAKLAIAIGPEGGFTEYEVEKLSEVGMTVVNIGARPLRSEFAVTAILAMATS